MGILNALSLSGSFFLLSFLRILPSFLREDKKFPISYDNRGLSSASYRIKQCVEASLSVAPYPVSELCPSACTIVRMAWPREGCKEIQISKTVYSEYSVASKHFIIIQS